MYRGPDCISQIYGARLKPIHDDALTNNLHASGKSIGTPRGRSTIVRREKTVLPSKSLSPMQRFLRKNNENASALLNFKKVGD